MVRSAAFATCGRGLRSIMRFFYSVLVFSLCAELCHAQKTALDDATFLKEARAKYDAPFDRNLQSFNCAVEFNWKQHFTEAVRVGDEGTDEEIAKMENQGSAFPSELGNVSNCRKSLGMSDALP